MDKKEFIKKIIAGFPESFYKKDIEVEKEKYNLALEEDLNFDKLYELMLKNWRYKSAPPPAYFQDFFKDCRNTTKLINMPSARRAALVKIARFVESPEYKKCVEQKIKAPWYLREEWRENNITREEVDALRTSGQLSTEGEPIWN